MDYILFRCMPPAVAVTWKLSPRYILRATTLR